MFSTNPLHRSVYLSAPVINPRDKYLAALAQAKAAEAEYLAAEAIQREEVALRQRLQEIQLLQTTRRALPYEQFPGYITSGTDTDPNAYFLRQSSGEAILRNRLDDEARTLQAHRERLWAGSRAAELRREAQQASLRREPHRRHQVEIDMLHNQQRESTLRSCRPYSIQSTPQTYLRGACKPEEILSQHRHSRDKPQERVTLHPALRAILGHEAEASSFPKPTPAPAIDENVQDFLSQIFHGYQDAFKPTISTQQAPKAHPQVERMEQALNLLFGGSQDNSTPANPSRPVSPQNAEAANSKKTAGHPSANEQPSQPLSSTGQAPQIQNLQQIFDVIFGRHGPEVGGNLQTQQVKQDVPVKSEPEVPSVSSLKAQLESRLNNEYASEIRDTIQAILASLQENPVMTSGSSNQRSSKGKAKSDGVASEGPLTPTSADVVKSMNEVRSIEATFALLESEFIFPSQLDFIASRSYTSSPMSSDTETSGISHLAFTSRNNPVRHYEQTLGSLLSQLDSVNSFGNDVLRSMRKDVVGRVERALEELEGEVEGRWKTKLAKEGKGVEGEATEPVVGVPVEVGPETTVSPSETKAAVHPVDQAPVALDSELAQPAPVPDVKATPDAELNVAPAKDAVFNDNQASSAASLFSVDVSSTTDSDQGAETHPAASLDASSTTIRPYDASPHDTSSTDLDSGAIDTFLLPAALEAESAAKDHSIDRNNDSGSDWSEVEA